MNHPKNRRRGLAQPSITALEMCAFRETEDSDKEISIRVPEDVIDSLAAVVIKPTRSEIHHPQSCLDAMSLNENVEKNPAIRNGKLKAPRRKLEIAKKKQQKPLSLLTEIANQKKTHQEDITTFKSNHRRRRLRSCKQKSLPNIVKSKDSILTLFGTKDSSSPTSKSIGPALAMAYAATGRQIPQRRKRSNQVKNDKEGPDNRGRAAALARNDIRRPLRTTNHAALIHTDSLVLFEHAESGNEHKNNNRTIPECNNVVNKQSEAMSVASSPNGKQRSRKAYDNFDLLAFNLDNLKIIDEQDEIKDPPFLRFCQVEFSKTDQDSSEISLLSMSPLPFMPKNVDAHTPMAEKIREDEVSAAFSALSVSIQHSSPQVIRSPLSFNAETPQVNGSQKRSSSEDKRVKEESALGSPISTCSPTVQIRERGTSGNLSLEMETYESKELRTSYSSTSPKNDSLSQEKPKSGTTKMLTPSNSVSSRKIQEKDSTRISTPTNMPTNILPTAHHMEGSFESGQHQFSKSSPSMTSNDSDKPDTCGSEKMLTDNMSTKPNKEGLSVSCQSQYSISLPSNASQVYDKSGYTSGPNLTTSRQQQDAGIENPLMECPSNMPEKSILWSIEPNSLKRRKNAVNYDGKLHAVDLIDKSGSSVCHGKRSMQSPSLGVDQKRVDNKKTPGKSEFVNTGGLKMDRCLSSKDKVPELGGENGPNIVRRSRRQRTVTDRFTIATTTARSKHVSANIDGEKILPSKNTKHKVMSMTRQESKTKEKVPGELDNGGAVMAVNEREHVRRSRRERKQTDFLRIGSGGRTLNRTIRDSCKEEEDKNDEHFLLEATKSSRAQTHDVDGSATCNSSHLNTIPSQEKLSDVNSDNEVEGSEEESEDEFIKALEKPEIHIPLQPKGVSFQGKRPVRRIPLCSRVVMQPLDKLKFQATSVDGSSWSLSQFDQLRSAHAAVDPGSTCFWIDVASLVQGKTAAECRNYWFSLVKTPMMTKRAKKRLESDADYSDSHDIFDSTPMRYTIPGNDRAIVPTLEGFELGDELEVDYNAAYFKASESGGIDDFEKIEDRGFQLEYGHQAYLQKLKRDMLQARKMDKKKASKSKNVDRGLKPLITGVRNVDIDMTARLSPGGTLKVHNRRDDDLEDDFWGEMYDAEDEENE